MNECEHPGHIERIKEEFVSGDGFSFMYRIDSKNPMYLDVCNICGCYAWIMAYGDKFGPNGEIIPCSITIWRKIPRLPDAPFNTHPLNPFS